MLDGDRYRRCHLLGDAQRVGGLAAVFARALGNVIALTTVEEKRVWPFFTNCGSKLPSRSRGVFSSNWPSSVFRVLLV